MSHVILCDVCSNICAKGQHFALQGWLVPRHSLILGLLPLERLVKRRFQRSSTLIFSLDAALGKGRHYPGKGKRRGSWEIKPVSEMDGLSADVCPSCLEQLEIASRCRDERTRDSLMNELIEQNPGISMLKVLRKTAFPNVISVTCDLCQSECTDKHIQISSGWVSAGNRLTAQVCEPCVNERLQPIVRFQVTPAKSQAVALSR